MLRSVPSLSPEAYDQYLNRTQKKCGLAVPLWNDEPASTLCDVLDPSVQLVSQLFEAVVFIVRHALLLAERPEPCDAFLEPNIRPEPDEVVGESRDSPLERRIIHVQLSLDGEVHHAHGPLTHAPSDEVVHHAVTAAVGEPLQVPVWHPRDAGDQGAVVADHVRLVLGLGVANQLHERHHLAVPLVLRLALALFPPLLLDLGTRRSGFAFAFTKQHMTILFVV